MKKILIVLAGWTFLLLGLVGLVLPIVPGLIFIVFGLVILSTEYIWAHHLLARCRERFPWLGIHLERARKLARAWM